MINIFTEYRNDLGYPEPSNGDLTPWTEHGVLLLNRVLTVQPRKPGSHRGKGWEEVTDQAIRALAARGGPLVAILWGRDAQNLAPLMPDVPKIESSHPARTRPTAGSSARVRSAGPTSCWTSRAASQSTGACPNHVRPARTSVGTPLPESEPPITV